MSFSEFVATRNRFKDLSNTRNFWCERNTGWRVSTVYVVDVDLSHINIGSVALGSPGRNANGVIASITFALTGRENIRAKNAEVVVIVVVILIVARLDFDQLFVKLGARVSGPLKVLRVLLSVIGTSCYLGADVLYGPFCVAPRCLIREVILFDSIN
jgi:hypothetical protein